jgi:RNA polymerase sigma factor (sigma-70 family)
VEDSRVSPVGETAEASLVDEDLVERVLCGREDLYSILIDRYKRKLMAHVLRMVRNREDALEITMDAFMKAYQHLARFDRKYRFSTWIYSIAGNAAIDHLRRRRLKTVSLDEPLRFEDSEVQRDPEGPARTAAEVYEGQQLIEKVEAAIAQLPEQYARLLLLRHPAGKSYDEIATITQLPLGTVKNRIFRARAKLREILGDVLPSGF